MELRGKMGKSLPIKDIKTIEAIKNEYRKEKKYKELLSFLLAINTGIKINDLLSLKVGDVLNKDILALNDQISNEIKTFILTKEIKDLIPLVTKNRKKDEMLFAVNSKKSISRIATYSHFNAVCKKLKIEDKYSIASWRKTFAYHYYKQTGDLIKLMNIFHQCTVQQALKYIDEEQNLSLELDRNFAL